MDATRKSVSALVMLLVLGVLGTGLWMLHAEAWDVGRRSPALNFDAAQYALAARELAQSGRLGTTFALPIDLARQPSPPWPLSVVQPGLVLAEAALFKLAPQRVRIGSHDVAQFRRADQREWLVLTLSFTSYLMAACLLALGLVKLLLIHAPELPSWMRSLACGAAAAVLLLDPESQHFATGGFTEMPFTLGLAGAFLLLASGVAPLRPFVFGLALGVAGLFRGNMLWLAPMFATAAASGAPRGRRVRVALLTLAGYALVLSPWWLYKWSAFGNPGWDLSALALWDGVEGRTWFSLVHGTAPPAVPHGAEAARLLLAKFAHNAPRLLLDAFSGVRVLALASLALTASLRDVPRVLRVAALALLAAFALNLVVAAFGVPQLRYLYPARILADVGGTIATLALVWRLGRYGSPERNVRALAGIALALFLGWGAWLTNRGLAEAESAAATRGMPSTLTLFQISIQLDREIPADEPVMSNLGPNLAWFARHPVVHLALTPEDVDACRRLRPFRHVLLAFREPSKAWPGWDELMRAPGEAPSRPEWNVSHVRVFESADGFTFVWLELGPLEPGRA